MAEPFLQPPWGKALLLGFTYTFLWYKCFAFLWLHMFISMWVASIMWCGITKEDFVGDKNTNKPWWQLGKQDNIFNDKWSAKTFLRTSMSELVPMLVEWLPYYLNLKLFLLASFCRAEEKTWMWLYPGPKALKHAALSVASSQYFAQGQTINACWTGQTWLPPCP
jgi:hypothetical protein